MKKKILTFSTFILCAMLAFTACNGGNTASSSTTTAAATSVTAESVDTSVTTNEAGLIEVQDSTTPDKLERIMKAGVRDTIDFNDYRIFQMDQGTEVFFANGKYVFTVNDIVVETREAVTVAKPSATVRDVLLADDNFDVSKCSWHFYNASGENVVRDLDTVLDETAPQCIAEYVDWRTDEDGTLMSYIFSYKDAPVKITAIYTKAMEESDKADTDKSDDAATTTAADTAEPEADTTTAGSEADSTVTTTTTKSSETTKGTTETAKETD